MAQHRREPAAFFARSHEPYCRNGRGIRIRQGSAEAVPSQHRISCDQKPRSKRCVSGGARWREVLAALDPAGLSPAVMQSSNDFAVGAAISVNAHGWPAPRGPVGSTVRAFRLMLADGTVARCSRDENAALFNQVIGGYGLMGVVIDAELEAAA